MELAITLHYLDKISFRGHWQAVITLLIEAN